MGLPRLRLRLHVDAHDFRVGQMPEQSHLRHPAHRTILFRLGVEPIFGFRMVRVAVGGIASHTFASTSLIAPEAGIEFLRRGIDHCARLAADQGQFDALATSLGATGWLAVGCKIVSRPFPFSGNFSGSRATIRPWAISTSTVT